MRRRPRIRGAQDGSRERAFDVFANQVVRELFTGLLIDEDAQRYFLLDAYADERTGDERGRQRKS